MRAGFTYRSGILHAEAVPLPAIAAAVGTPCYVYAANAIRSRARRFLDAFAGLDIKVCYAVKANGNLALLRLLRDLGLGADVVSGGELERALAAGIDAGRVVFSGVGKSRSEMARALDAGILQFNVESVPELLQLAEVARAHGQRAAVALRINPDIDAGTHDKISTGRRQDKFGIAYDEAIDVFDLASRLAGIDVVGVHLHIGSQILSEAPFEAAYTRALALIDRLRERNIEVRRLDVGGGMGVSYGGAADLDFESYAAMVRRLVRGRDLELVFEPGRYLVAEAGALLARAIYVKDGGERPCLILDAGMNDLLRPALYNASHPLLPIVEPEPGAEARAVDVVGPICESADVFARAQVLPAIDADDLLVFLDAGAYGAVMASDYNSRPLAAEVLVDGDRYAVVRRRIEPQERFHQEAIPEWLGAAVSASELSTTFTDGPAAETAWSAQR